MNLHYPTIDLRVWPTPAMRRVAMQCVGHPCHAQGYHTQVTKCSEGYTSRIQEVSHKPHDLFYESVPSNFLPLGASFGMNGVIALRASCTPSLIALQEIMRSYVRWGLDSDHL
jgi:hypothetical protein